VVVTPAGIGSANIAVSVSAAVPGLPNVMVNVAVPPATIVAGVMLLASVTASSVTVSGALAGGVVPASVCKLLVVLVTVPGVDDLIETTIVQPPGGMVDPDAMVTNVVPAE